jgi:hypothetical protein
MSNIEQYYRDNPRARRNAHGTRPFSMRMWDSWLKARQPDEQTARLRGGIEEFRRLLERPTDGAS